MKRKTFILLLLLSSTIFSKEKKFRIEYKANTEFVAPKRGRLWFAPQVKYTLGDFTLSSMDSRWKFNVLVQGKRSIITRPDIAFRNENLNVLEQKYEPEKIEEKTSNFFGESTKKYEKWYGHKYESSATYKFPTMRYTDVSSGEKVIFNDETQGHVHDHSDPDHDHEHEHAHEEGEEHNHSHTENRQDFNLLASRYKKRIIETNDLQARASIQYFNGLNGFKYTQYLTSFLEKHDELRRYGGDSILELKNTNVFKDKYSLSFIPRLYTRKIFKPLAFELDTDFRYKHDEDTVIGAYLYNGVQLENMKERLNFKNRIELFYDNNQEVKRFHKFYEILDHEHDKINQFKVSAAYTHKGNYQKESFPEISNLKFNQKEDKHRLDVGVKYKKTDFLVKDLIFENETNFKYIYETLKKSNGQYFVTNEYKFQNSSDQNTIIQNGRINGGANHEIVDKKIYKTKNGYEVHRVFETEKETDGGLLEESTGKRKIRYVEIIRFEPTQAHSLVIDNSKTKNNLNVKNKTKIKYKGFVFENKLDFSTLISKVEYNLKNKSKISYEKKFMNNIVLKPYIENDTLYYKGENKDYYAVNKFRPGIDFKYIFDEFDDVKITVGVDAAYEMQQRKAPKNRLVGGYDQKIIEHLSDDFKKQVDVEADKWVHGAVIKVKPYVEVKWDINNNLAFKLKGDIATTTEKSAISSFSGAYNPISKEYGDMQADAKLKLSLEYRN